MMKGQVRDLKMSCASALRKILASYEEMDCILFEPVTFTRSTSAPAHLSGNGLRRPTVDRKPVITGFHAGQGKALPSLPEDEDTRRLRAEVTDLEHQSIDLTIQTQLLQQKIGELTKQIAVLTNRDSVRFSGSPPPSLKRDRVVPARGNQPVDKTAYYRGKYEEVKAKYEEIRKDLSQKGRIQRVSMSNLRQIAPPA
jgi:hypothetical protein